MTQRLLKRTLIPTLLGASALTLSGCSGGSPEGEFFGAYNCSTNKPCGDSGDLVRVVIDGDDVTYDRMLCDGDVAEDDTNVGVLNESRDTVAWTLNPVDPTPFTANADGDVVTVAVTTYSKEGTDAGDALLEEKEEDCTD